MDLQASLESILQSQDSVGTVFYNVFLEKYPEVQKHFEKVNMKRQAVLLTMALMIVGQCHTKPFVATRKYLQYLGTKHNDMQIPKELYPMWCDALLETLSQFHGDDWSPQLAKQWKKALDRAIELMFEGYDQHFHV